MRFRPCIDLHGGQVQQIVGSTFSDDDPGRIATNFASTRPAAWFAELYRRDGLPGGQVIMLGPGTKGAAAGATPRPSSASLESRPFSVSRKRRSVWVTAGP